MPLSSATVSALPGISFITGQQTLKHLGVRLGYDMQAACHTLLETGFVIGSLHTLPSVMMHEGDASFLVGHLWLLSIVSP